MRRTETDGARTISALEALRPRVRYVPMHVAHHAGCSGYDALFRASTLEPAASAFLKGVLRCIPDAILWRLWALRPQPSQRRGLEAEIGAASWLAFGTGRLTHFIYGEDSYFYSALWKRGGNKCIATFHYPPALLARRINVGCLGALDGVIIVGENQRQWFEQFVPADRIHYCPHHVQTDYFQPASQAGMPEDVDRLICVGKLLRDYDLLERVVRRLQITRTSKVCLDIVAPRGIEGHPIASLPNVRLLSGISDNDLRTLYQSASVGVLPLQDATANNALLEMMSCGLPVVVSDVGGIGEYIKDSGAVCLPADEDVWCHAISSLLDDPSARNVAGQRNRARALDAFSFDVCARRLAAIYGRILV